MRCAAVLGALLLLLPIAAHADEAEQKREAQSLFEAGVKQAQDGNTRAALSSFRGAYGAYPNFRVLYNVGQLCEQLSDPACALRAYTQYLKDGGDGVPQARRQQVDATIKSLAKAVGSVVVKTDASGAAVTIDDVAVGKAPLADPVPVNPGARRIAVATKEKTVDKTVNVAAGDVVTVELGVVQPADTSSSTPAPPVAAATSAPTVRRDDEPAPRRFPIVPWAVTGALAAGTVVTGIFAANAYTSYQDKKQSFPVTRGELDDAQSSARTLFIVTSVLGAATVISGGVSAYLTLRPQATGAAVSRVRVAVGPRGVSVVGAWP